MKLKRVEWDEVKDAVRLKNQSLARLLEEQLAETEGPARYVWKASYKYGEMIFQHGKFQLDGVAEPERLGFESDTCYAAVPLSLVLGNYVEVYTSTVSQNPVLEQIFPLRLLKEGDLFGTFEVCDALTGLGEMGSPPPWHISSGARSAQLIMNIKDSALGEKIFAQLKEECSSVNGGTGTLHRRLEHMLICQNQGYATWHILKAIADAGKSSWTADVLVFPNCWLGGIKLRNYVLGVGWRHSHVHRRGAVIASALQEMSILNKMGCNKTMDLPAFLDHLKQIFSIARGDSIAFVPVTDSSAQSGPFRECQEWLVERKLLGKKGAQYPVILQPWYLTEGDRPQGFYSASRPSVVVVGTFKGSWKAGFQKPLADLFSYGKHYPKLWDKLMLPNFELECLNDRALWLSKARFLGCTEDCPAVSVDDQFIPGSVMITVAK